MIVWSIWYLSVLVSYFPIVRSGAREQYESQCLQQRRISMWIHNCQELTVCYMPQQTNESVSSKPSRRFQLSTFSSDNKHNPCPTAGSKFQRWIKFKPNIPDNLMVVSSNVFSQRSFNLTSDIFTIVNSGQTNCSAVPQNPKRHEIAQPTAVYESCTNDDNGFRTEFLEAEGAAFLDDYSSLWALPFDLFQNMSSGSLPPIALNGDCIYCTEKSPATDTCRTANADDDDILRKMNMAVELKDYVERNSTYRHQMAKFLEFYVDTLLELEKRGGQLIKPNTPLSEGIPPIDPRQWEHAVQFILFSLVTKVFNPAIKQHGLLLPISFNKPSAYQFVDEPGGKVQKGLGIWKIIRQDNPSNVAQFDLFEANSTHPYDTFVVSVNSLLNMYDFFSTISHEVSHTVNMLQNKKMFLRKYYGKCESCSYFDFHDIARNVVIRQIKRCGSCRDAERHEYHDIAWIRIMMIPVQQIGILLEIARFHPLSGVVTDPLGNKLYNRRYLEASEQAVNEILGNILATKTIGH